MRGHHPLVAAITLCASIGILNSASAQTLGSAAPDSISFQGFLTDTTGDAASDGMYNLQFRMYKGSAKIWEQDQVGVPVKNGVFDVVLSGTNTYPLDTVAFNQPIDLAIRINGGAELTPRTQLTSAPFALGMRGLTVVSASKGTTKSPNLVGGAGNNYVASGVVGATIGGGGGAFSGTAYPDSVTGDWGTIGGGNLNRAGTESVVGGGSGNKATASNATIAGGIQNHATSAGATVAGGTLNFASGENSFVGAGRENVASGFRSSVPGGYQNVADGSYSIVAGGRGNRADGNYSFAAGYKSVVRGAGSFVWNSYTLSDPDTFGTDLSGQFLVNAPFGFGIGTSSPASRLHIEDVDVGFVSGTVVSNDVTVEDTDAILSLVSQDDGTWGSALLLGEVRPGATTSKWAISRQTATTGDEDLYISFGTNATYGFNAVKFQIETDGEVGFYGSALPSATNSYGLGAGSARWTTVYLQSAPNVSSDRRLKTDIVDLSYGIESVLRLRPVSYGWNDSPDLGTQLGLVAQDVQAVVPEVVSAPTSPDEFYSMKYEQLVPVLIKAIQDQQAIIEQQGARLGALEARVAN